MATKTFDELIAGATAIKNNELPESNTHNLVGGQLIDMATKHKESDQQSDVINVTTKFPLTSGSYYTSSTARSAVTAEYRKLGKKLLYQTDATTWVEEKFIGSAITDAIWNADANWLGVASKNDIDKLGAEMNQNATMDIFSKTQTLAVGTWKTISFGTAFNLDTTYKLTVLVSKAQNRAISIYKGATVVATLPSGNTSVSFPATSDTYSSLIIALENATYEVEADWTISITRPLKNEITDTKKLSSDLNALYALGSNLLSKYSSYLQVGYIDTNGTLVGTSGFHTLYKIPLTEIGAVVVNLIATSGMRTYQIEDESGNKIEYSTSNYNGVLKNTIGKFISFSYSDTNANSIKICEIGKYLYNLINNKDVFSSAFDVYGSIMGYISNSGVATANSLFKRTGYVPISNIDLLKIHITPVGGMASVAFYDASYNYISCITETIDNNLIIPVNAVYVIFSCSLANVSSGVDYVIIMTSDELRKIIKDIKDVQDAQGMWLDLFSKYESEVGYISNSGVASGDSAFKRSKYVPVEDLIYSKIHITALAGMATAVFYNEDYSVNSIITSTINNDLSIPFDAVYVKFSSTVAKWNDKTDYVTIFSNLDLKPIISDIDNRVSELETNKSGSIWAGKKIVVCGDSISAYSAYPSHIGWAEIMASINGSNLINYACSGQTLAYNGASGFSATSAEKTAAGVSTPSYETAILGNLDADLFIIEYGANDMWNWGGTDQVINTDNRANFEGAFNWVMHQLFTAKPHARVIFVGFWHRYDWNEGSTTNNDAGYTLATHQKAACNRWNIPFIDVASEIGWTDDKLSNIYNVNGSDVNFGENVSQIEVMSYRTDLTGGKLFDRLHPYETGAKTIIGKYVAQKLNSIY